VEIIREGLMRAMRGAALAAMAIMAMSADLTPSEGHSVGPGEKKSPARGVRLRVEEPRAKKKSASLQKLLRK
jgi:hypothetical protein